jgi:tRNA(Ser,Leu) C12 N-acetylase TAN1
MDWNVVVTVYDQRGMRRARRLLSRYGEIARTEFYNVLVLRVPDVDAFVDAMAAVARDDTGILNDISRIMPAHATFTFESVAEFEDKARSVAGQWTDRLAGKSFHVRLHRRRGDVGVKLRSHTEETALDKVILQRLSEMGRPGQIRFEDPDYVLDIETVGSQAGMSLWSRDDLGRFAFLRVD